MLSDAILDINEATRRAREQRERRAEARAALSRAEELSHRLEETLLRDHFEVPDELGVEIQRFVALHERALVRRLGDAAASLDVLFDLQERLQARRELDGTLQEMDRTA